MKKLVVVLTMLLGTFESFSNVNYINFYKITSDAKLEPAFTYLKDNQQYYDHWEIKWSYARPRSEFVSKLRECFKAFSAVKSRNEELYLLLGDIAHYLYNMDDSGYYDTAVLNYDSAIANAPQDYRGYWFLAYHYALSSVPDSAIDNFGKAEKLLPLKQPADFWNEYAEAAAVMNLPSHCIYAMERVKSISGKEGSFQAQLGPTIYKRIVQVDKDRDYDQQELWTASGGKNSSFTSRPLGIKITVDSTWNLSIYDYKKHQGAFIITPPPIANKKGRLIHYTIAILMKTVNDNDRLDDYLNAFVSKYPEKEKIRFSDKYEKMIAYEIKDQTMYQDIGGGHLYMLGVERKAPQYAGLLLENPAPLPQGESGVVNYYTASDSKDRFKGTIFYAIMLDSCEDIHEESLSIFRSLFENQIIIE